MAPALIALTAFAVVFPLVWVAVCALASGGGWGSLAKQFPRGDHRPTVEHGWRSVAILAGWLPSNYGGCVTVGANEAGLFLSVALPFRLFHPPLFIPWAAIQTTARQSWLGKRVDLTFADVPGVTVRLPTSTASELADAVGGFGGS